MLFGDWGTSRLYVLGLALYYAGFSSFWFMLAMSGLLVAVGWAYQVICRIYPDGGGVYSSARHHSELLSVVGALLLCADYIVTAAISSLDAFHYIGLHHAHWWAAGSIALLGAVNYFGPTKAGTGALVIALAAIASSITIAGAAAPDLDQAHIAAPAGQATDWWRQFTALILAISGVEAVANMTGIMVEPVARTSRWAIRPVLIEIVVLNLVLTLAMLAVPAEVLGGGDSSQAFAAHRDTMLRLLAEYYVGPVFAAAASVVFALLLLSAANTAVTDLVSIQYMMARDRELPPILAALNRWGMPVLPLVLAGIVPIATVVVVPDVGHLADLYAIGVVGAVAVNLGSCATNFSIALKRYERAAMGALFVLLGFVWVTIAYEKPAALAFALSILGTGLAGRWVARNRAAVREWLLAPVPTPLSDALEAATSIVAPAIVAPAPPAPPKPPPSAPPRYRILVAMRGRSKLASFAIDQAKAKNAELYVLFVRHLAMPTAAAEASQPATHDAEAEELFQSVQAEAERAGVTVQMVYAVAYDVADAILEFAATLAVDVLLLGATRRGMLWRTMKGDIIQRIARYLPERIDLLIHG